MGRGELDWQAIAEFYRAGNTKGSCQDRFGFSDWDWHAAVGRGDVVPRTTGRPVLASERRAVITQMRGQGLSYSEISRRLGVSKATVAYHARRIGVVADDKCARRYDWVEVQRAIDDGMTLVELIARFGFARASYTQAVKRGDIVPRDWMIPLEDLLVIGRNTSRSHLKQRLIREGLKENRCEQCGITEWQGNPINMQLHHKDGDGTNNQLENLEFLCPNCHSQTDTYGGRNGHRRKRAP